MLVTLYVRLHPMQVKTTGCFILWGGLFYTWSHQLYHTVIAPYLFSLAEAKGSSIVFHDGMIHLMYNILWQWPAYLVIIVITNGWHSDIGLAAAQLHQKKALQRVAQRHNVVMPARSKSFLPGQVSIAEDAYRILFFFAIVAFCSCLYYIPGGSILSTCLFQPWLYSWYCFDYHWSFYNVPLSNRRACLKEYWLYFVGFGVPLTVALPHIHSWAGKVSYLACVFPVGVVQSVGLNPQLFNQSGEVRMVSNPLLDIPMVLLNYILKIGSLLLGLSQASVRQ